MKIGWPLKARLTGSAFAEGVVWGASLDPEHARRLRRASRRCGLSTSALVRQGLVCVIAEVEATGALTCHTLPPRPDAVDREGMESFRFRPAIDGARVL